MQSNDIFGKIYKKLKIDWFFLFLINGK
jgi:hypothetical protein